MTRKENNKMKTKMNWSNVRIVRLFDCGRLARRALVAAVAAVGLAAWAEEPVYIETEIISIPFAHCVREGMKV